MLIAGLELGEATIDHEFGPSRVRRVIARQKQHGLREFSRFAEALQADFLRNPCSYLRQPSGKPILL
jgi:hypothetical protein